MVSKQKRDPLLDAADRVRQEALRSLAVPASVQHSKNRTTEVKKMEKQADRTYSCVVTITAKNEDLADELRSEIAGAAEDNHESGEINADATVGPLVAGDIDQKLEKYRALHDRVSDLIEDGKLEAVKTADPRAYDGLIAVMAELAGLDPKPAAELAKQFAF